MKLNWKLGVLLAGLILVGLFLMDARVNVGASDLQTGKRNFDVSEPVYPVLSVAVRDLTPVEQTPQLDREINPIKWFGDGIGVSGAPIALDPLAANGVNSLNSPLPLVTFEGLGTDGYAPPDTVGDVGPNHYVQMVNVSFQIWDKGDPDNGVAPSIVQSDTLFNQLFTGFGGSCETDNDGDPIVVYDDIADRWVLSQFAVTTSQTMCFAVSTTPDPTGAYYLYGFPMPDFPDYPKLGVWPDAYYLGTNTGFPNQYYAHAFDRASMLAGSPATRQSFGGLANFLMPADADGTNPPPVNEPGIFYTMYDQGYPNHPAGVDRIALYEFDVDWATPANSAFTLVEELPVAAYNYTVCGFFVQDCVPQPGTAQTLDTLSYWPMFRFQYRNFGGSDERMVGNFTVDLDNTNKAAIRWFEIHKTGSTYSLFQEGTYAPDASHRWMGSIAMDRDGNIALGYSVSDATTVKPSIRYATRSVSDPLGTLSAEAEMWTGNGVQTGIVRWGDYSNMVVDPVNGCHFWYTTQYHDVDDAGFNWNTRIGVFRIPECGEPDFTLSVTPATQAVCTPDDAVYAVDLGSLQGYNDPVTLSAAGNPAGTTVGFSTNPVVPPGASTMTIGNIGAASAGSYGIEVHGVAPTSTHTTTVTLEVYTGTPGVPALVNPPDGDTNVARFPTLEWTAVANAQSYDLEVATDAGFTNVVYNATGIAGSSHTLATALDPLTAYYWHVRANNECGNSSYTLAFSFTTEAAPPILLVDDDDNSPDVQATYTNALDNLGMVYDLWDTANSDDEPDVNYLSTYEAVIWFTGAAEDGATGPGSTAETALGTWLDDNNGCFFLSSQDYHYNRGLTPFMTNYLGIDSINDDNGDYTSVTGQGSVFGGLGPYSLTYPFTDYSDIITPTVGAELAFLGNNANEAAVNKDAGYKTTFWVFPWEVIANFTGREASLQSFLVDECGIAPASIVTEGTFDLITGPDTVITQTLTISNTGASDLDWSLDEEAPTSLPVTLPTGLVGVPQDAAETIVANEASISVPAPLSDFELPAGSILYDNGPLTTHPAGGAGSADASALQTASGMNTYGFGHAQSGAFRIADDFTVPAGGWTLDQVIFYAYQTGSPTTSSITGVYLHIWDGPPNAGGNIIWGDTTTNLMSATIWSNIYRVLDTNLVDTLRPIMANTGELGGLFLPEGTYWLDWQTSGSLASGPWAPPVTVLGSTGTGNALQFDGVTWASVVDVGPQDFPFQLVGTTGPSVCSIVGDIPWVSVSPASGTTSASSSSDVAVIFDSAGMSSGIYTGTLCLSSNDPVSPLITIPLTLTVDVNADLSLVKTAPANVTVNDTFTYTLEVTNAGPATASSTTLTDTLPTGVTFVSATAGCSEASGVVTCNLGDLASGAMTAVVITVTADTTGILTNTADVSSSAPDPNTSNNSDSADTEVAPAKIYLPIIIRD